jgi:hypothetical protein
VISTLYAGDEMWLHATVVSAWRDVAQPLCLLLLRSTAGFLAAPLQRRESHAYLVNPIELLKVEEGQL